MPSALGQVDVRAPFGAKKGLAVKGKTTESEIVCMHIEFKTKGKVIKKLFPPGKIVLGSTFWGSLCLHLFQISVLFHPRPPRKGFSGSLCMMTGSAFCTFLNLTFSPESITRLPLLLMVNNSRPLSST